MADERRTVAQREGASSPFVDGREYEGRSLSDARQLAKDRGLTVRVVGEDGSCVFRTNDLDVDRVNFYVVDGRVESAGGF